jgi:hypothetical protein
LKNIILKKKIRGVKMNFTDNQALPADDLNNAVYSSIAKSTKLISNNLIRQLQDRTIELTKNEFAEAYIDADGRLDSVDTVNTTALFLTNIYTNGSVTALSGTTYDPDTVTNPNNAFNNASGNYAEKHAYVTSLTASLGKTFTSRYVSKMYVKCSTGRDVGGGTSPYRVFYLGKYKSGTWTWTTVYTYSTNNTGEQFFESFIDVDDTVEGLAIKGLVRATSSSNSVVRFWLLNWIEGTADLEIHHNIETGQFNNLKNVIGVPFTNKENYNDLDIEYKLTNTTEDTGWLNPNQINKITGFTNEPTKLIINFKDSNYQEIKGFSLFNEED